MKGIRHDVWDEQSGNKTGRSQKSIDYAILKIKSSPLSPYVRALYLYGSCARNEQGFKSDVDLFMELDRSIPMPDFKESIILLKSQISPINEELPEIDLKVVIGDSWKNNTMLYYQNIRKDGINLWIIH